MSHRQFIRNAAFCLSLALPLCFVSAADEQKEAADNAPGGNQTEVKAPAADIWAFLPEVVASVGDKQISKADFVKEMAGVMQMAGGQAIPPEYLKQMAPKVAESLVDRIILLEMAEQAGVKPSSELVISEFNEMFKAMPAEQKSKFEDNLKQQGTTVDEYIKKLGGDVNTQKGIAIDKYIQNNILNQIKVSDSDAEKFYNEKQDYFKTPESVTASHILIKPEGDTAEAKATAKAKAEDILKKLQEKPESFEALAEADSACPSGKEAKGSLGKVSRGQTVPEFEKVAFALEPGKLSEVVETPFGFHIIKVTDKTVAGTVPFEKVKDYIKEQLTGEKVQETLKAAIDKEKAKLNVKINI